MWIDDQILAHHRETSCLKVFVPETPLVVLGSGNKALLEVDQSFCKSQGIPITRRYGGGGTVVLYPGCVVISYGAWVDDPFQNSFYFRALNEAVIDALSITWPSLRILSQAGISDIVAGEKKVAGTSLFRSRHYLLYQASLLVTLDANLVAGCLKHPTKEPDYRMGRKHESFLTSIAKIEPLADSPLRVAECLTKHFEVCLKSAVGDRLTGAQESEFRSLEERLERAEHLPDASS